MLDFFVTALLFPASYNDHLMQATGWLWKWAGKFSCGAIFDAILSFSVNFVMWETNAAIKCCPSQIVVDFVAWFKSRLFLGKSAVAAMALC